MRDTISPLARILALACALSCASASAGLLSSCASADAGSGPSPAGTAGAAPLPLDPMMGAGGRTLVVFYSQGNATRRAAADIAGLLGADIEEVRETAPRGQGFFGFMHAGYQATFGIASRIEAPRANPADYARVVVCTPVWSWHLSPPVRAWLRATRGRFPETVGFVTVSGDTKPDKIALSMEKEAQAKATAVLGLTGRDFSPERRADYEAMLRDFAELLVR